MAKTRADVVNRALKNLGVLPQGQVASAEDYNSVNALLDGVIESLQERDIYFLQDVDATPEAVFIPLGQILAWAAAPVFDQHDDASLAALAQKAEMDLQAMDSLGPTYQVLEIQAY